MTPAMFFGVLYVGWNWIFFVAENLFTLTFTLELVARLMAHSWIWLFEKWENFADSLLVMVTGVLVTWVLQYTGLATSELRKFTILRVLRLYRLALDLKKSFLPYFTALNTDRCARAQDRRNTFFWS